MVEVLAVVVMVLVREGHLSGAVPTLCGEERREMRARRGEEMTFDAFFQFIHKRGKLELGKSFAWLKC